MPKTILGSLQGPLNLCSVLSVAPINKLDLCLDAYIVIMSKVWKIPI